MFPLIVRRVLEVYLTEKRIPWISEFDSAIHAALALKDALFVTLYLDGNIIASSGRIQCQKQNSFAEAVDLALMTLKDSRFAPATHNLDTLWRIKIRVDRISPTSRRMVQTPADIQIRNEGVIFLSQNYGILSVVLPNMVTNATSGDDYFDIAVQKAWLQRDVLNHKDYVIYALSTVQESDFI